MTIPLRDSQPDGTSRSGRARAACITLVDAILIIAGSAAVAMLLGGRTRGVVAGIHVVLRSPGNLFAVSGGLLALRLLLDRRLPPLPIVSRSGPATWLPELHAFAQPARATRQTYLFALAALLGSLVWILPHLTHIRQVPDAGDPLFSAWRIARITHQLTHDPRHLFDGNIFYPRPLTMAYSDATLLQSLAGAPFVAAGVDPLIVSNAVFLLAFPGCALAFFYAAWRLTDDPRAALIAGLVGAWYPFHTEHYSHMELQFSMFVPLALVGLLRLLAAPSWRTGVAFGAAVALQWLACMYIGVMLATVLVPFAILMVIAWRVRPTRRLVIASIAAAAVMVGVIAPASLPYLESRTLHGSRQPEEVAQRSALASDYLQPHSRLSSYGWVSRTGGRIERQLLPGASTVALAAAGIAPPIGAPAIAVTICAALAFDWSLGLNGLTYDDLYKYVLPYRGMRAAARFDALLGALLALLAGWGAHRLIRAARTPAAASAICAALAVIVLLDLRMSPVLQDYYATVPTIYQRVTPSMVLAEFPVEHNIDFMYFSTRHWARLLGGYSGFTAYSPELLDAYRAYPDAAAIAALHRLGATHLTYNCALEPRPWRCDRTIQALDDNPALELVASERWERKAVRLYRYR